jgi:cytochrome P450
VAGKPGIGENGAQAQRRAAEGISGTVVKTSELHIAPDRQAYFASLEPKVWLESSFLRTWVVAEPSLIVRLLRSRHASVLNVDDMIGAIERAYGVEFPNVRYAARHLPLFLEGEKHAEQRRNSSRYLAGRMADLEINLPLLVERHLRPLRSKGRIDLVSEVTTPLVRDITSIFVDCPVTEEITQLNLLDVFALNKSLTRFKDLDLRVGKAKEFLAALNADEELLGSRFSALSMGFETILVMLTEGLHLAFRSHPVDGDGPIVLPAFPIETGVPISYRRALSDFEMAGHAFKAGDLLRLQLQVLGYSDREQDKQGIFGAGVHSCVGKQVSLRIWAGLKQAFDRLQVRGRASSYDLVPSHYMVRYNSVHVEVF